MNAFPAEYSEDERRWLLRLAHASIRAAVMGKLRAKEDAGAQLSSEHPSNAQLSNAQPPNAQLSDAQVPNEHLREKRGAFVTLRENGKLRGCIGMIVAQKPLDETLRAMARAAALEDPRFAPVEAEELERLQLEISVLSPMFEIAADEVIVGRHGLMISYGVRRGLLLPQVPVEWKWNREQFLAQTCLKAGLPPDQWQHGAKIEAFTAEVFGEREPGESLTF
jgi:uncharacterized protein